MIAAIILAGSTLLLAALAISREPNWKRCPICGRFHNGNVTRPNLPTEADGTVSTQICLACQIPEAERAEETQQENFPVNPVRA